MASHDLHFTVSQNGIEDPSALHDPSTMPSHNPPMAGGGGGAFTGALSQSAHPFVCIFHIIFKASAFFLYIFGGWFAKDDKGGLSGANFITVTVFCILLLAADFWVVKNITGRLLVGLRWWNKVEGDTTKWIFESAENRAINKFDSSVFWSVLYATPIIWSGSLILGLLKFNFAWLIIVITALALSTSNVYGYYKCSSDQKARFQQMMARGAQAGATGAMSAMLQSGVFGMLAGTNQQQQGQGQGGQQQQTFV